MNAEQLQQYKEALRDLEAGLYILFGRDDHYHTFLGDISQEDYERFDAYGQTVAQRLKTFIAEREGQ
jgi:hypothetical protein